MVTTTSGAIATTAPAPAEPNASKTASPRRPGNPRPASPPRRDGGADNNAGDGLATLAAEYLQRAQRALLDHEQAVRTASANTLGNGQWAGATSPQSPPMHKGTAGKVTVH